MKYILKYLSDYKKESILAPLFKMLEAVFELLVPLVVAGIIDHGIASGDRAYVLGMSGLMIALAIVGLVSAVSAQYFSAKAAILAAGAMRRDLFYHIGEFSEYHLGLIGGDALVTRLTNDVNQVQGDINMFLRLFLRSPIIVFGAAIMAFTVDVKAALIFAVAIPLMALCVFIVMKLTLPRYKRIQTMLEHLLGLVRENLTGVRVIRAFRNEEKNRLRFADSADELYGAQLSTGRISAITAPVTYAIVNLSIIMILMVGGRQVDTGRLSTGDVVALLNYMSQILVELIKLANLILLLTKGLSSAARISTIMDMEPDERNYDQSPQCHSERSEESHSSGDALNSDNRYSNALLELKSLSFAYPDSPDPVLSDISLNLKAGEMLGIIGGTGSGKSTLISLITHRFDPTSGSVTLMDRDIHTYHDEEMATVCGVVPQQAQLFAGTISDNLRAADPDATEEEMWEALEAAQAADFVRDKERGLSEPVLRNGRNFSGGQRQRLTIARALITKAPIIILDDSASALDMATEKNLREALRALPWNPALIVVSQRASSVLSAEHILVLEGGEAVGYGTSDELLSTCEVYKEIYNTQFS